MVSNDEMVNIGLSRSQGLETTDMKKETQVEWVQTYAEAVGKHFFEKVIPALAKLGKADKVRIVFWFDN